MRISDKEQEKLDYLFDSGFEYDDEKGVYSKLSSRGVMMQIHEGEVKRQYIHQLHNLVMERAELAEEAYIVDKH